MSRSPSLSRSIRCSPLSHQLGVSWYFWLMIAPIPLDAVTFVNLPVGGGGLFAVKVSVAAPELVLPALLVTIARNWSPWSPAEVLAIVKLAELAPLTSTQVVVPLSILCHWYVTGSVLDAPTVNVTGCP